MFFLAHRDCHLRFPFCLKRAFASHALLPKPSRKSPTRHAKKTHSPPFKSNKSSRKQSIHLPLFNGPYHTTEYVEKLYSSTAPLRKDYRMFPRSPLHNFYSSLKNKLPKYHSTVGHIQHDKDLKLVYRTMVQLDVDPPVVGTGDHPQKKNSVHIAALSAVYQLHSAGVLDDVKKLQAPSPSTPAQVVLSDGSVLGHLRARGFLEYYCRQYRFNPPDVNYFDLSGSAGSWEARMTVGNLCIGIGKGGSKKEAHAGSYLDAALYLERFDPNLWKAYVEAAKTGKHLGLASKITFKMSKGLEDDTGDLCDSIRKSSLYRNRPSRSSPQLIVQNNVLVSRPRNPRNPLVLAAKSQRMLDGVKGYLADESLADLRKTRMSLPVYGRSKELLKHIQENDVTICMAATGSGKTTQVPQIILDDYIKRERGATCNIICTQPRRLAAIGVADRVAQERGETLGKTVGYHVRFDAKLPEPNGSVTFCTTGIFLKRLQTVLSGEREKEIISFDTITHIIVDEVHERDVDTDLLLVVLKELLARKKKRHESLKIILMSATISPTLFQEYFRDDSGVPCGVISIPGRSFPVAKYFMDDFVPELLTGRMQWVKNQDTVIKYLNKELDQPTLTKLAVRPPQQPLRRNEDLELPYPLIAATIAHVLKSSDDGHVLVFLPGWEEIMATQKALLQPMGPLVIDFKSTKYEIHLLHSSIPLNDQKAVFSRPLRGTRRIILSTNIAETSITIPDVVYVVDTAKIKEQRYDPDLHMTSLASEWVGSSNLNQRAGRAGRHRSGDYFGLLGKKRSEELMPHQTVEMKRVDLSSVVMHVKALNFPMTVEEVLAACIEPPDSRRVQAAMKDLQMVGALDTEKNLTSLGRVLLQLPVDARIGRLVLYGCFFRCLDHALTLAAILSNRDIFMAPMHLKKEAQNKKHSWTPDECRSDVLASLQAYNAWWGIQSKGEYSKANEFCLTNFLSRPTLLLIRKVRSHILQSLQRVGAIEVSAGGELCDFMNSSDAKNFVVPASLNANNGSLPLLTALIAMASQPNFAVRSGSSSHRTLSDKMTLVHPGSVNNSRAKAMAESNIKPEVKQLYAFWEKRRNETTAGNSTFLVTTTRLDPLIYILFGAYDIEFRDRGLICDDWLPIVGDIRLLDQVLRLKTTMEACLRRVFEGISMSRVRKGKALPIVPREYIPESEFDDESENKFYNLSSEEIEDLDFLTKDVVYIITRHNEERIASQLALEKTENLASETSINPPMLFSNLW